MAQTKIKAGLFEGVIGNGTDGYFLMSNGDGTMTWSSIVINPTIASIAYPGSVTAADPAGGETITVTGTGFKTGATVTIGGTAAPAVSYVSATQITFTTPAKAAGDYDIVVTNTDTGSATYINGISYNGIPTWTTAAGSLGTFASETTISTITLQATEPDAGTITFSITNGALPTGLSLTGANIDGTTTLETADTLYTFTVTATDDESQATPRTFTITVRKQFIGIENFTINTYTGNGSTQSIEGKIGTAASFNGSSSEIDLGNSAVFSSTDTGELSISLWINTTDSDAGYIFSKGDDSQVKYEHNLYLNTNGTLRAAIYNSTAGLATDITTTDTVNDGNWHHVVLVIDNGTSMSVYVDNGTPVTSTGWSGTVTYQSTVPFLLGAFEGIPASSSKLNGKLDQVRIFNKALSSSEVTTLYGENNTSTTKSTTDIFDDGSGVALYEFEKGAKDTGGTNGYIGAAGVFNGSSSKIVVSGFTQLTSDVSASMWIKFNSISSAQKEFFDWVGNSSVPTIRLNTYNSNDIRFQIGSGQRYISADSLSITTGVWYHIAFSIDRSANTATLYFNGSALGSTISSSGSSSDTEGLFIGSNLDENRFSDCVIDQIRLFNKAISSSEVTTLYGETSASATKSTTDIFGDSSGVALYELEGNANDTSGAYNGTATNVSYGTYDGTPTNVSFVGTSFTPDFVWVKDRSAAEQHGLFDSVRGADLWLHSETTQVENNYGGGYGVTSFDLNGFSIGNGTAINRLNDNYIAWCWKAGGTAVSNTDGTITSQVSANPDAGFSIVKSTYTSALNYTVGHGLNERPQIVFNKNLNQSDASFGPWWTWIEGVTGTNGDYIRLNSDAAKFAFSDTFTTDTTIKYHTGFQVTGTNKSIISYCFHSVDGYQKVGTYSGSNSPITITTGFQPRFLMVKRTDTTGSWIIIDSAREIGSGADALFPNLSGVESSSWNTDFISTGFTISSNEVWISASGGTYIYLAIA